jgi:CheY-like chemotaxis protein
LKEDGANINVIIFDIMMPVMNSREFFQERNQNPVINEILVVVISADVDENCS